MEEKKKIKQTFLVCIVLFIGVLLFPSDAFGAPGINKQLPYQAVLKTSAGVNVADGDLDMLFKIYSVSTGGSPLWTGTHTVTNGNAATVTDGVFSVLLGSGTGNTMTVDFTDDTLYLSVTIGADPEMTPRKRIGASGYAFNTDTLDGIDSLSFLRSDAVDTMSASSTSTLLTITQSGTGDILNIFDGATEVFTILDGGNVGIGTSSPSSRLHALVDDANTASTVNLLTLDHTVTATSTAGIGTGVLFRAENGSGGIVDLGQIAASLTDVTSGSEDGILAFFTAGPNGAALSERMRIDSSGNVGIGTADPQENLVVGDDLGSFGGIRISIGNSTADSALNIGEDTNNRAFVFWNSTSNFLNLGTKSAGVLYNNTLVIKDGNVGIGSTNPDNGKLVVASGSSENITLIAFDEGSGGGAANNFKFRGDFTGAGTSNVLLLEDFNGNIDMAWSAGGKVGIGASDLRSVFEVVSSKNVLADLAVEENYHLKIRNPNNTTGEGIGISFGMSSTNSQQTAAIVSSRTGGNGQGDLRFYTKQSTSSGVAPVFAMIIDEAGDVGIGDTAPAFRLEIGGGDVNTTGGGYRDAGSCVAGTCASDVALKQNVQSLDNSLERILKLNPSTFEFIDPKYGATTTNYGLIAQEVEPIFPEWVVVRDDGYKSIRYGLNIQMHMLRAIQEQQEQIFTLSGVEGLGTSLQGNINGNLDVENLVVVDATFEGDIVVRGHVTFNEDTVGQAKVLRGDTSADIRFAQEYTYPPIVTVTPFGVRDIDYGVENVTTEGFTISIAPSQGEDVTFNWHAFGPAEPNIEIVPSTGRSSSTGTGEEPQPEAGPPPAEVVEEPAPLEPTSVPGETAESEEPVLEEEIFDDPPVGGEDSPSSQEDSIPAASSETLTDETTDEVQPPQGASSSVEDMADETVDDPPVGGEEEPITIQPEPPVDPELPIEFDSSGSSEDQEPNADES